jgi:hypothetical protein
MNVHLPLWHDRSREQVAPEIENDSDSSTQLAADGSPSLLFQQTIYLSPILARDPFYPGKHSTCEFGKSHHFSF